MSTLKYIFKHKTLFLIIFPAFIFHMLMIMPSGSHYCLKSVCGIFFWGPHSQDSIWHLALSETAFDTFPFRAPNISGVPLGGYNILLDFVVFILSKLSLPSIFIFFKLLPVVWFVLFTIFSVSLAIKIHKSTLFVALQLFFFYFAGSFGYFFTLFHGNGLTNSADILAMQSRHTLFNLQYAFSLVVLLFTLNLYPAKKLTVKTVLFLGIGLFIAVGLKFYAGVICGTIVLLYVFKDFLWQKKIWIMAKHIFIITIFSLASLFIFYNPLASMKSGSMFIFSPFAVVHNIIEEPHLFYLPEVANMRYILARDGMGPRLLIIELFSTVLYIFFNMGVRIFGFAYILVRVFTKKINSLELFVFVAIALSTLLPVLFIQKGVWWNSIQFFYYALFLSNIFLAQFIFMLFKNKAKIFFVTGLILCLLAVPINFDRLDEMVNLKNALYISQNEMIALTFLKNQPDGVVLTIPYKKIINSNPSLPSPLYGQTDATYVSAFSGKVTYLTSDNILELLALKPTERIKEVNNWNCNLIKKIDYIYDLKVMSVKKNLDSCKGELKKIFENKEVRIYKVMLRRDF